MAGRVVYGDPVLLRKITNMFIRHSAERRNAECLRLISFVTLKAGERRPTLTANNIDGAVRSKHRPSVFPLSFLSSSSLSSFPHHHHSPFLPLIPIHRAVYCLIAFVFVTTLLHSLVQTATCETDKHPLSPSILTSI